MSQFQHIEATDALGDRPNPIAIDLHWHTVLVIRYQQYSGADPIDLDHLSHQALGIDNRLALADIVVTALVDKNNMLIRAR